MSICCENCFIDEYLKDYIRENGTLGDCEFCGESGNNCIDTTELRELFEPVVRLYSIVEDFMPAEELRNWDGKFIWDKLDDDWQIFSSTDYAEKIIKDIFFEREEDAAKELQFLHSFVEREDEYWGDDIEHNRRLAEHWEEFREEILHINRFFPQKSLNLELLTNLFPLFTESIKQNTIIYRARISHDGNRKSCAEMGKPPADQSINGRANPIGIPYLYVASDIDTAISEVRPSIGDRVTVGKFRVVKDLRIVDLREPRLESPFKYGNNLENALIHLQFMRLLGNELSNPVNPRASDIEYVPTQYLCEFIKTCGFGVMYESTLGNGYSIAIFHDTKVKCVSTELYLIEGARYTRIDP